MKHTMNMLAWIQTGKDLPQDFSPEALAQELKTLLAAANSTKPISQPSQTPKTTQGKAFRAITNSGLRQTQADRVLEYVRAHPNVTREQIAKGLAMRTSSATGRVKELLDSRRIYVSGYTTSSAGMQVETLAVVR